MNGENTANPVTLKTGKVSVYRTMQNKTAQGSFQQKVDRCCKKLEKISYVLSSF